MSIPAPVREELTLKAGDLVIVVAHEGYLMARKVDLEAAARLMAVKSTYL
jgi:bifunctional DNA-binding transcriptional regulator/antitoxin component of YhaV-PrlF toxin-antitoxin module